MAQLVPHDGDISMYVRQVNDEELDDMVEALVRQAIAGLDRVLTPQHFEALRAELENELRFTEDGRKLLRQGMNDPSVSKSAEVRSDATATEPIVVEKKTGADGGK